VTIAGIPGSLRQHSYNAALLRAAQEVAPEGVSIDVLSIRDVPLYDGDVLATSGLPPAVTSLKDRVAAADGVLIATPEYNNSIPGAFKNVIDWMSRPSADIPRVFGNRPVALMGAATGRGGTLMAQAAWLPVLRALGVKPWFGGRMNVSLAHDAFDTSGRLIDDEIRRHLQTFVAGFAAFIARG
jgi:chromate reductase